MSILPKWSYMLLTVLLMSWFFETSQCMYTASPPLSLISCSIFAPSSSRMSSMATAAPWRQRCARPRRQDRRRPPVITATLPAAAVRSGPGSTRNLAKQNRGACVKRIVEGVERIIRALGHHKRDLTANRVHIRALLREEALSPSANSMSELTLIRYLPRSVARSRVIAATPALAAA